jgi:hypothetical protein
LSPGRSSGDAFSFICSQIFILECQVAERPRLNQFQQSEFDIRYIGKDPIIKFSFDDKNHISLWSKVADGESWADEWARVRAYVVDLFQLSEMPKLELTYVDEDGDEITMLVILHHKHRLAETRAQIFSSMLEDFHVLRHGRHIKVPKTPCHGHQETDCRGTSKRQL